MAAWHILQRTFSRFSAGVMGGRHSSCHILAWLEIDITDLHTDVLFTFDDNTYMYILYCILSMRCE